MQLKILPRLKLLIHIIALFALFIALLFYFITKNSIKISATHFGITTLKPYKQEKINFQLFVTPIGKPVRLKIPKINVDANIEYVGLTRNGAMDVPKSKVNVAWLKLGQRPGENGTAVIAGHFDRENGKPAVFNNLYKLRKGDKLYIEDNKGVNTTFVVRKSRSYDPNANASDVFGSNDRKSHLNLITCEGIWNKVSKSYSKRLVVFTDKE